MKKIPETMKAVVLVGHGDLDQLFTMKTGQYLFLAMMMC